MKLTSDPSFNPYRPGITKLSSELSATLASFERERSKQLLEIENLKNELKELKDRNQQRVMSFQRAEVKPLAKPLVNTQDSARSHYFSNYEPSARKVEDKYREIPEHKDYLTESVKQPYEFSIRENLEGRSGQDSYKKDYESIESSYRYNPGSLRREGNSSKKQLEDEKKYIGDNSTRLRNNTSNKQLYKDHERVKVELDRMGGNLSDRKEHDALINKYKPSVYTKPQNEIEGKEEYNQLKLVIESLTATLKQEEKRRGEVERELKSTKEELEKQERENGLKIQQMEDIISLTNRDQLNMDENLIENFVQELFSLLNERVNPTLDLPNKLSHLLSLLTKTIKEKKKLEEKCSKLLEERNKLPTEPSIQVEEVVSSPSG
jgi:hypothetical protein